MRVKLVSLLVGFIVFCDLGFSAETDSFKFPDPTEISNNILQDYAYNTSINLATGVLGDFVPASDVVVADVLGPVIRRMLSSDLAPVKNKNRLSFLQIYAIYLKSLKGPLDDTSLVMEIANSYSEFVNTEYFCIQDKDKKCRLSDFELLCAIVEIELHRLGVKAEIDLDNKDLPQLDVAALSKPGGLELDYVDPENTDLIRERSSEENPVNYSVLPFTYFVFKKYQNLFDADRLIKAYPVTEECAGYDESLYRETYPGIGVEKGGFSPGSQQVRVIRECQSRDWRRLAMDVSHGRRLVWFFDSLSKVCSGDICGEVLEEIRKKIALHFAQTSEESFVANYLNGDNSWYRVNYNGIEGFGFSPGELTKEYLLSGYCLILKAEPELLEKYNEKVSAKASHMIQSKFDRWALNNLQRLCLQ